MHLVLYVHLEQQQLILNPLPDFLLYLKICSEAQILAFMQRGATKMRSP